MRCFFLALPALVLTTPVLAEDTPTPPAATEAPKAEEGAGQSAPAPAKDAAPAALDAAARATEAAAAAAAPADGAAPTEAAPADGAAPAEGGEAAPAEGGEAAPAEPAPPVVIDVEVARSRYRELAMGREALEEGDPSFEAWIRANPGSAVSPWGVARGQGFVDASEFATLTSDSATSKRIDRATKRAKITSITLYSLGGALIATSVVPLIGLQDVAKPSPEPALEDYTNAENFVNALEDWRAEETVRGQNQNRVWASLALGTTGALAIVSAPFTVSGARERRSTVGAWYDRDAADAKIKAYNQKLAEDLGLQGPPEPPPTAVKIAAPRELEDERGEDGLEDPSMDPSEDEGPMPGGPPVGPTPLPTLQIQGWISPGMIGLQGTF